MSQLWEVTAVNHPVWHHRWHAGCATSIRNATNQSQTKELNRSLCGRLQMTVSLNSLWMSQHNATHLTDSGEDPMFNGYLHIL